MGSHFFPGIGPPRKAIVQLSRHSGKRFPEFREIYARHEPTEDTKELESTTNADVPGSRKNLVEVLNVPLSLSVFDPVSISPVTVTVAYHVVPGHESDFHSWGWAMLAASAAQPGFMGGGVLVDREAEWHVVYRFDSEGSALAWEDSLARKQWETRTEGFARQTARHTVQGAKEWFNSQAAKPAASAPPPPSKWKLWFVNMSAVFPPVLLFNIIVLPYLGSVNPFLRALFLCLCVTALVTWILMPRLQRFFKKWLYPPLRTLRGRHKRRTA